MKLGSVGDTFDVEPAGGAASISGEGVHESRLSKLTSKKKKDILLEDSMIVPQGKPLSLMDNPLASSHPSGFGENSRRAEAGRRNAREAMRATGPSAEEAFAANESKMTDDELSDLTHAFNAVDMDGGGYVDLTEFGLMMDVMGCDITEDQIREVFATAKKQFAVWLESKDELTRQRCRDVWADIDWDMSGDLGKNEIHYLITSLRQQGYDTQDLSKGAWADGIIDFEEFSTWFVKQDGFAADFGEPPGKAAKKVPGGLGKLKRQRGAQRAINKVLRTSQKAIQQMALLPVTLARKSQELIEEGLGMEEHEVRLKMRNPEHMIFAEFVFMMRAGMLMPFLEGAKNWQSRAEDMRRMRQAFDVADVDGNNQLKLDELELVFRSINANNVEQMMNSQAAIEQVWAVMNPENKDWISFSEYCKGLLKVHDDPSLDNLVALDVPNRFQLLTLLIDSPISDEQKKFIDDRMNILERFGMKVLEKVGQQKKQSNMEEKLTKACKGELHFLTDNQRKQIRSLHFICLLKALAIGAICSIMPGIVENLLYYYYETDGNVDAYWTCPGTDHNQETPSQMLAPYAGVNLPVCPFGTCTSLPADPTAYLAMGGAGGGWSNVRGVGEYPMASLCGLSQDSSYYADCDRVATPQRTCVGSSWQWCESLSEHEKLGCSPLESTPRPFSDKADGSGIGRYFGFNFFNLISIVLWVAIEISLLVYSAISSAVLVSEALELRLTPINEDRAFVGAMLVRAAFEMPDTEGQAMGVNSEADPDQNNHWLHNLLAAAWYKGKTFITGRLIYLVVLATMPYQYIGLWRPYITAGIATVFWDTACCHHIMKKAERRAIGVTTSIEVFNDIIDTYCPNYEKDPSSMSQVVRVQLLRAIGVAIVRHGSMHPTMELMLRHAVEYLGMKKSRFVLSPGVIDNMDAFIEDFATLTLAESRAVLSVHMLGYVLDGNIESGEHKFWNKVLQRVEVLHQAKRTAYLADLTPAHVRWFIVKETPWHKEAVDAVMVAADSDIVVAEEADAVELEALRKILVLPERATVTWPERHGHVGSAGPIPALVCQRFRANKPVTTEMLKACFDPPANVELRKEVQGCARAIRFRFNEFTFVALRAMMATF